MADNYLITGYWGEPHVTAENDRGINAAMFGTGRFVLPVGEQFKAEYIGNNTIRMYDGKLMDNGAAAGIPVGEYVDLLIANAGQGKKRNDLIVFQYSQDASTLVESGKFVVIQGAETDGTASDPELTQEDLLSGEAAFDQFALWRVSVSGATIAAPVKLFSVYQNNASHAVNKNNPHGVTAEQVGARPNTWLPSIADIGAAPAGYGLGGNGEPKNWSEVDNLISNGKYQIANINQTINGISVTSASLDVIYYGYNYGKQILRTVETASGSGASYTLERSRGYAGWEPWECDNAPFILGAEYRTTERLEGKPVYKKLINMGILASANGVVSVPHGISDATYIIGCRGIATQQGTQYGYEMASNDIQVEGGYVNWYDRNSTSSYYGYALISYLKD